MTSYEQAVRSWTDHLRSGGTTPWSAWATPDAERGGPAGPGRPSAAHLEVARRLNELTALTQPGLTQPGLVDLVLGTAPTGRGLVDPPLAWAEAPRFGSPPVQPDRLPTDELVRVAVPALARLLPGVPAGPEDTGRSALPLPWRRAIRVHGSPATALSLHEVLREHHFPSSGRIVHLVVARPLEVMMAEHWHVRSLRGSSAKWWQVWRKALARDSLPSSVQLGRRASRLLATGRPVHLVVAASDERLSDLASEVVGRRVSPAPGPDPAETDLLRRLNPLLALAAGPDRVGPLVRVLRRRVLPDAGGSLGASTDVLAAPPWAQAWAADRAHQMADQLRRGGYAVHGHPDEIVPADRPGSSGTVDGDRTLELALAAAVRAWQLQGGTP